MRAKVISVDRALQALFVLGAAVAVVLGVLLATSARGAPSGKRIATASGTGTPVATSAAASGKPPVLPLPGKPGFPPKLDSAALTSQEVLPNFVSGFPGIPTSTAIVGYPPVRQVSVGGVMHNLLVFNSAFFNRGPGPVLIWGHRAGTNIRDMTGDQYIRLKNGSYALRRKVGGLRYIYPAGLGMPHLHWHFVGAEVYAVYPAGKFGKFSYSHKQGFCMSEPPSIFTDYCGYKNPGERSQLEAMYAHTADYYNALVEGQEVDITGLPPGRYVLLNWVNSKCQVKETTYADNAASTAFTLSYPQGPSGAPTVTLGTELNGVPHPPCPTPSMTSAQAKRYVQQAAVKKSGGSISALRVRCTRASATAFNCAASWQRGAMSYRGRLSVSHVASAKLARYKTALDGITTRAVFAGTASRRRLRWSAALPLLRSVQPAYPLPGQV